MQHTLHYSMELPLPIHDAFNFFADVANLQRITPPELNFSILTPLPVAIQEGAKVDFMLKLLGVPFKWQTEISVWDPPNMFVDRQIKGPYAEWVHTHAFRSSNKDRTIMEDDVTYTLPSVPLGELAHPLVRKQLERIFNFRRETILKLMQSQTT